MNRPNFFVAGAPKCGTTSLHIYLSKHPQVFLPEPKEPHFFCSDFPLVRQRGQVPTIDDYLALFRNATNAAAVGEASPLYFLSESAPTEIHDFCPTARIVVMLRNPVEAVHAFHAQWVLSLLEDEPDFERAWRLQPERAAGRRLPRFAVDAPLYQYARLFSFSDKVERWRSVFPPEQVHIILFDDFVHDTRSAYQGVLAFLGLPDDGQDDFPKVNVNRARRLPALTRALYALSTRPLIGAINQRWRQITGLPSPTTFGWQLFEKVTARPATRASLSDALRREIVETFRDDVTRLSRLLDRDLSHWSA